MLVGAGVVVFCNPSARKPGAGGLVVQGQPQLHKDLQVNLGYEILFQKTKLTKEACYCGTFL